MAEKRWRDKSKLERTQDRVAKGQHVRTGKLTKMELAASQQKKEALAAPTTSADYRAAEERALADTGAFGQANLAGQPMGIPGSNMAGQVMQMANQQQSQLRGDVMKKAVSQVDLEEQIRLKKQLAEEAKFLQLMALKKSGRKGASQVAVAAAQGASTA